MKSRELAKGVYWVGAIDWDRRLFDELIPLPDGTSYNAYLVKGEEKCALIGTVDPSMEHVLLDHLDQLGIANIDYVVTNHAEQDHSGTLPRILERYPGSRAVSTVKCKGFLSDLLLIPEDRIMTVEDGEMLSLGGRSLKFIHFPWVHWPETMVTYLVEDRILFSCDLFGSHYATSDLSVVDEPTIYEAAKRYYAEIMMPFRTIIQRNLDRLKDLQIATIAPSHGPIHSRPELIIDAYKEWTGSHPRNIVVLPYVSMHGSTERMVDHLVSALTSKGISVKQFNLSVTDLGKLAIALVDAATIIIGSPTVLAGPHPSAVNAVYLANALRPKAKLASVIGSYGWGGKTVERITQMLTSLKVELLEPVLAKGYPREEDFKALDRLAEDIRKKHVEYNLIDSPEVRMC